MSDFYGYPTRRISSDFLELDCLATAGPRIVRLSYKGAPNLFAEVPGISVPTPYGDYHYLGGHRLWHAPESMPRSYIPDGDGLTVSEIPSGLILDGKVEPLTGIHKRIQIGLGPDPARVTLTHTLINEGPGEVELAPWALTMFRLGGTAILPARVIGGPSNDLLPDRHFSLWPYTRIIDPRLHLEDDFLLVAAKPDLPPFKIGTLNPQGWSAYWLDGILFRKTFAVSPELRHPDYDCNAEIYCDERFLELESLAPLARLAPGGSVTFRETWELYETLEQGFFSKRMIECLAAESAE
jgi:hypothetical protein